ncbi:uncharacterized protein LOC135835708 isoform X2 [Planococcus citri]|uniref:uncharacterized protein LOC135835708 isoform X2 n=1 Tax=Planococcus citri TaxID=170843 RepID=UPI0031F9DFF0
MKLISRKKCILGPKNTIFHYIRKPLDCSVCTNKTTIDTVTKITQTEFEEKYAYTGRPLVVRDAARYWKAMEAFDYEFFKHLNDISQMHLCQFINYNEEFKNLNELFAMDVARIREKMLLEPWYVGWSVCDPIAVAILRDYYEKPSFLPKTSENYIVDWIFMGTPGHGAKLHAQIKGKKRWIIKTPTECLYTCEDTFSVDMKPGDIIVLDSNRWYHSTEVISKQISITVGAEYD